jgi:RNA polymerase sigma-70 factor (ECF subfamily)
MSAKFDNDLFLDLAKRWPAAAAQYLHKRFYTKLVHLSFQRTNNMEASKDIAQDVLIAVWRKLTELSNRNGFLIEHYLYGIVKKKSISYYRNSSTIQRIDPDSLDLLANSLPSIEDHLNDKDIKDYLQDIVARLPRRERRCIQLKYFEGMSNDSIATNIGISKKSVERLITNGLRLLRLRHRKGQKRNEGDIAGS